MQNVRKVNAVLHSSPQVVEMSKRVKFEFDETSRVSLDRLREQGAMLPPLPNLDVSDLDGCPDFDEDCRTMSLDAVCACRDYDGPKLTGVCTELHRRQVSQ